jgi:hypothetical protein
MIKAEIEANNAKATQVANEQGGKVDQNVAAGVVGPVIWPIWFGMDFKDAAGKEAAQCHKGLPPAAGDLCRQSGDCLAADKASITLSF